jgi:hypothetical protein
VDIYIWPIRSEKLVLILLNLLWPFTNQVAKSGEIDFSFGYINPGHNVEMISLMDLIVYHFLFMSVLCVCQIDHRILQVSIEK